LIPVEDAAEAIAHVAEHRPTDTGRPLLVCALACFALAAVLGGLVFTGRLESPPMDSPPALHVWTPSKPSPQVADTLVHAMPKPPVTGWSVLYGTYTEVSPGVFEFHGFGWIIVHTETGDQFEEVGLGDRVWETDLALYHSFPA